MEEDSASTSKNSVSDSGDEELPSSSANGCIKKTCGLCIKNESKYCCPRCSVLYCSLDCYKSDRHLQCSEKFYHECIKEELSGHYVDNESKTKMMKILKKMQDDNPDVTEVLGKPDEVDSDDDDDDEADLHERMKNLDLNDADAVWNALNQDEKNEFEALLKEDKIQSVMPDWIPWWFPKKGKKLVQDVDEKVDELKKCPKLVRMPKFKSLTSIQPSPVVKYNIVNVLASYAFMMRLFLGDPDPFEGVSYFLDICANMDQNVNFKDVETAVTSVANKCIQSELIEAGESSLDIMRYDTFLILQGPSEDNTEYYSKAALSHLHQLFDAVKDTGKPSQQVSPLGKVKVHGFSELFPRSMLNLPDIEVKKLKKCHKKIEYYLSYVETYSMKF